MNSLDLSTQRPRVWYEITPGEGKLTFRYRIENPHNFTGFLLRTDLQADVLVKYKKLQLRDIRSAQRRAKISKVISWLKVQLRLGLSSKSNTL